MQLSTWSSDDRKSPKSVWSRTDFGTTQRLYPHYRILLLDCENTTCLSISGTDPGIGNGFLRRSGTEILSWVQEQQRPGREPEGRNVSDASNLMHIMVKLCTLKDNKRHFVNFEWKITVCIAKGGMVGGEVRPNRAANPLDPLLNI